jgi:amino acid transporter
MVRALLLSIGLIASLYLLVNVAYLRVLGVAGMSNSDAVAADLMRATTGPLGAQLLSLLAIAAALSSASATIFTGARTSYALGKDFSLFAFLGHWNEESRTPANALWVQGGVVLLLIALGAFTRQGFSTMVDYTAPVFWFFFFLTGVALLVLRQRDPDTSRPFRVPFYPFTPLAFCLAAFYMLWSSLTYTGIGALVGVGVLFVGFPLLLLQWRRSPDSS